VIEWSVAAVSFITVGVALVVIATLRDFPKVDR